MRSAAQLVDLVEDLLHVGLAARRGDHLGAEAADLLEALRAHLLGQHHHRTVAHAPAHPGAADAIVAGGGPDRGVLARLHLAQHLLLHQAASRRGRPCAAPVGKSRPDSTTMGASTPVRLLGSTMKRSPPVAFQLMLKRFSGSSGVARAWRPATFSRRDAGSSDGVAHLGERRAGDEVSHEALQNKGGRSSQPEGGRRGSDTLGGAPATSLLGARRPACPLALKSRE